MIVDVIIPALNEAQSIGHVLAGLRDAGIRTVIVVDNGSTDGTDEIARAAGATIVYEPRRGYGQACLAGLAHLSLNPPDAVLFLDGDGADDPEDIPKLLAPLSSGQADFVVGSRTRGPIEPGALTFVQHFGNLLSCALVRVLFGVKFTGLGSDAFHSLAYSTGPFHGRYEFWMDCGNEAKAARRGVRCTEVPVHCRRRYAGKSKVSGTIKGSVKAGTKILYTIGREALRR